MKHQRLVIYPQDIQRITGRSERYAQTIICLIKKRLGREKHQQVTREEFCEFLGLNPADVDGYL